LVEVEREHRRRLLFGRRWIGARESQSEDESGACRRKESMPSKRAKPRAGRSGRDELINRFEVLTQRGDDEFSHGTSAVV
jgi:hypothetical protein